MQPHPETSCHNPYELRPPFGPAAAQNRTEGSRYFAGKRKLAYPVFSAPCVAEPAHREKRHELFLRAAIPGNLGSPGTAPLAGRRCSLRAVGSSCAVHGQCAGRGAPHGGAGASACAFWPARARSSARLCRARGQQPPVLCRSAARPCRTRTVRPRAIAARAGLRPGSGARGPRARRTAACRLAGSW